MRKNKTMDILNFSKDFGTEEQCKTHYKMVREKEEIKCKKCECTKHYWLQSHWQWQCSECSFRTTLKSGTIMEHSKMPFTKWYAVIAFMTFSKKGISATEMQRQLGHKWYQSIWRLMHKVRVGMGKRDALYQLTDMVELDEGYFTVEVPEGTKLKRGKGSQKQNNVMVMAESTRLENPEAGEKSTCCRYFKMKVLEGHNSTAVDEAVKENVAEMSFVFSDKSASYNNIANYVEAHIMEKSNKETTSRSLKWVHIAIGNARKNFLGVYHKMKGKYLQNYLDEFCYKLNRRYFGKRLFQRATIAMATGYL